VVLGQVIRVEAGRVETLDLQQPLAIDPVQPQARHRLDVVEDAESQGHAVTSVRLPPASPTPRVPGDASR
jgi:hypothetical protein